MPAEIAEPAVVLVPITSDKGLCGAVNSSIVREIKKYVAAGNCVQSKSQIFCIGEKGTAGLTRPFPDMLKTAITQVGTPYNYPTVMAMAVHVSQMSENSDKIVVFYNEFKSAISYLQRQMELMPRKRFLEAM